MIIIFKIIIIKINKFIIYQNLSLNNNIKLLSLHIIFSLTSFQCKIDT